MSELSIVAVILAALGVACALACVTCGAGGCA